MFRSNRYIRMHLSLLVEWRGHYNRSVPVDGEHPHIIVLLEYAVIGTRQVLLLCLCRIRRRNSSRRKIFPKADEYHQTDQTAATSSSFKPHARMFRSHRKIRTRSSLVVDWRRQVSPTSLISFICGMDFLVVFPLAEQCSGSAGTPARHRVP